VSRRAPDRDRNPCRILSQRSPLTSEKARSRRVETRLDRALKSCRLGLTSVEVGTVLCGASQIVRDDEVHVRQCHVRKLLRNVLEHHSGLVSDNDHVQQDAGTEHADRSVGVGVPTYGQRPIALGIVATLAAQGEGYRFSATGESSKRRAPCRIQLAARLGRIRYTGYWLEANWEKAVSRIYGLRDRLS